VELGANWDGFDFLDDFGDEVEAEDNENSMDEIEITASNCRPTADVASNNNHVFRTTDTPAN
jgi:hypothetical protein